MINNKPSSEQTSWQDRLSCRLFSLLYTTAIVEAVVQYTLQRFPEEASLRECLLRIEQLFWNSWLSLPPFWSFARPPKRSQKTLRVKFVPRFPIVSGVGNCSGYEATRVQHFPDFNLESIFITKYIFIIKNPTDFGKTVKNGVDPCLPSTRAQFSSWWISNN